MSWRPPPPPSLPKPIQWFDQGCLPGVPPLPSWYWDKLYQERRELPEELRRTYREEAQRERECNR